MISTAVAVTAAAASETGKNRISDEVDKPNLEGPSNKKKDMMLGPEMYKTDLDVDTSIDEVIYNLIEVRNANRPDLPKLINPLKGGLAVVPPPDLNIPPKKGRGRPCKYPRVIENIRLRPPDVGFVAKVVGQDVGEASTPPVTEEGSETRGWSKISRKKRSRRRVRSHAASSISRLVGQETGIPPKKKDPNVIRKRRMAKTAAITVTGNTEGFSYAEALTKVKQKVPLIEMYRKDDHTEDNQWREDIRNSRK